MSPDSSSLPSLAKSAGVVLAGTIFGQFLGLLAEVSIVRFLDPVTYGRISLAYTIVFSLGSLALLGVHEGVTRELSASNSANRDSKIIGSGLALSICSASIFGLAIILLRGWAESLLTTEDLGFYLLLVLPYLLLHPVATVLHGTLRGQKKTLPAVLSKSIMARGIAFCLLIFLTIVGFELYGAAIYWTGYPILTFLFISSYLFIGRDSNDLNLPTPDPRTMRRIWSFSWPLAIGSGIFILLANLDVLMIGYFLRSEDVGHYRAVQPLKQVATFAIGAFTFLFLPLATEHYETGNIDELDNIFSSSTKWILFISLPPSLIFIMFSPGVVNSLFGDQYLPAAPVLSILVAGLLIRSVSGLNGDMVKAIDRPSIELISGAIGLGTNFLFNVILIQHWGIIGAAVATVFGYTVYNIVELGAIWRYTGVTPFSRDTTKLLISMFCVALILRLILPNRMGLVALIALGVIITAVQPLVLVITQSVDKSDLELVERVEKRSGFNFQVVKKFIAWGI